MQYLTIIYDFANQLPNNDLLFPLVMLICGLGIIYYNKNLNIEGRKSGMVAGFILSIFSGIILIIWIPINLVCYFDTRDIYDNKQYKIVEGRVANYHPMQKGGHGDRESFSINGIDFKFSDFDDTYYGYKNVASKGGAIKENLLVRIYYFNHSEEGNVILRLEIEPL